MSKPMLDHAAAAALAPELQRYMQERLDMELGGFDAQFLLQFVADKIGPAIYNQALADAQTVLGARLESLQTAIWELEQ